MGEHRYAYWFSVVVGPFLGGAVGYFICASILGQYSWCISGEEHCVREWVSALSGWGGAIVAGFALFALVDQVVQQRKQTAFSVGESPPTITVVQDIDDAEQVVVRVVNWNRGGLLFENLDIEGIDVAWLDLQKEITRPDRKIDVTDRRINQLYLRGWEDRSKGPEVLQIKLAATSPTSLVTAWPPNARVRIDAYSVAETHKKIPLRGHLLGWAYG